MENIEKKEEKQEKTNSITLKKNTKNFNNSFYINNDYCMGIFCV